MEINCNKCENLLNKTEGCKVYGSDPAIASLACAAHQFKNYSPKKEPRKAFAPGERVYIVERDEDGNVCDVSGYLFLAEVADTAIVTPKVYGCDTLEEILAYHVGQTAREYDTDLAVFPADDCYPSKFDAMEARIAELEDDYE